MNDNDYRKLRDRLFETLWREFPPLEEEIESTDRMPKDIVVPMLRGLGAFGLLIPEQYGGFGLSVSQYVPIITELSKIHGGLRGFVHAHNSACHTVGLLASDEQKEALLPRCAVGDGSFGMGITEPDHGTGADIGTSAVRDGDDYVINGQKWLTTNSDWVSHFIVYCKTAPGRSSDSVSAILVDHDTPGLSIEPLPAVLGTKGCEHGHLRFENVRVPITNRLGPEGAGLRLIQESMAASRVFVAASSLGTAERALELSVKRAQERVTFGKPIASRQAVQRYLAEMATDVYALRHMLADATARLERGEDIPGQASMCKLFGLEAACRVTDRALLVFGGIGFTRKYPIERMLRDARANVVEEGPPTIQYLVIARSLLAESPVAAGGSAQ